MAQISALIAGPNKTYDHQVTALAKSILNAGVISSTDLLVTLNSVAVGEAFILVTRTNGQKVMVHYQNTAAITIDTSGTKKVWVGISQSVIDDGSTNAVDGTGIATIQTGASYPVTGAYIPLASITSGNITDARVTISGKPILQKGLTANSVKEADSLGNEVIKTVSIGSMPLSTETLRKKNTSGNYEDFTFSELQSALSPINFNSIPSAVAGEDILQNDCVFQYDLPLSSVTPGAYWNLGYERKYTRIVFPIYTKNVSGNTIKIWTDKVSASYNLKLRIEGGTTEPNGTLVDANAIVSLTPASVTAAGETTFTFPASLNLSSFGTKLWGVLFQGTYGEEPISNTSYYKIGISSHTKQYVRAYGNAIDKYSTSATITLPNGQLNDATGKGVYINSPKPIIIKKVYFSTAQAGNIGVTVAGTGYTLLAGQTSVDVNVPINALTDYTVIANNGNFAQRTTGVASDIIKAQGWMGGSIRTAQYAVTQIDYEESEYGTYGIHASSTMMNKSILYKSSASNISDTTNYIGLSLTGILEGAINTIVRTGGLDQFTGLTKGSTYYMSNTPGVISTTAGTNSKVIGIAQSTTELYIKSPI